jgi:hypothetical protein
VLGRKGYCVKVKDFRGTQPRYLSFINAQKLKCPRAEFDPWTIDSKDLPPQPAYRLSVGKKGPDG